MDPEQLHRLGDVRGVVHRNSKNSSERAIHGIAERSSQALEGARCMLYHSYGKPPCCGQHDLMGNGRTRTVQVLRSVDHSHQRRLYFRHTLRISSSLAISTVRQYGKLPIQIYV